MNQEPVELVEVVVDTRLGDKYVIPSVSRQVLERYLPKDSKPDHLLSSDIAIVNVSFAVLTIPARIVWKIWANGELWMDCNV